MIGRLLAPLAMKIAAAIIAALMLALAVQTARIEGFAFIDGYKAKLATSQQQTRDEIAAHRQTKKNYRDAQAEAERLEQARLARVTNQQKEISDALKGDFENRLADARARYERLRREAGRTGTGGASDREHVPGVPAAPGRADAAAADNRFPRDELDWRLTATEQAIQLGSLIEWVEKQHAVDPNRSTDPPE